MNIEEATENLKKYISFSEKECNFPSIFDWNWHMELANDIETLLTAYEKEKEEHKKECHNCDEYTARLGELETENRMLKSELEKQSKEIEELKDKNKFYNTAYNLGKTYSNKKWEDKIKAKIEDILNSENGEAIEKLIEWQSLLEKE